MTGPEHYRRAQELAEMAGEDPTDPDAPYAHEAYLLAAAQVHATLALTAATATAIPVDGNEPQVEEWAEAGAW